MGNDKRRYPHTKQTRVNARRASERARRLRQIRVREELESVPVNARGRGLRKRIR